MPALNNSPPVDASGTLRGLVNLAAQSFAGAKTFLARAVMSLGITSGAARLDLRSDLGGGVSDVCAVAGTTVADASTNEGARLLSLRTGLGGTEVEHVFVRRATSVNAGVLTVSSGARTNVRHLVLASGGAGGCGVRQEYSGGGTFDYGGLSSSTVDVNATNRAIRIVSNGAAFDASTFGTKIEVATGGAGTRTVLDVVGEPGQVSPICRFMVSTTAFANITASGRLDQYGTDSSGTPGAATINRPTGISAIASGATTIVVTNSLAATTSRVLITWLGDHGAARSWVTRAAGSFTVNLSAAASGDTSFAWEVSALL